MIRNADERVSVVALARFRCRFCTKSLLSLLLRRPCKSFAIDVSLPCSLYEADTEITGERCAPSRVSSVSARRGERSPFVTSVSVDEGEFNAECFEPSAE